MIILIESRKKMLYSINRKILYDISVAEAERKP